MPLNSNSVVKFIFIGNAKGGHEKTGNICLVKILKAFLNYCRCSRVRKVWFLVPFLFEHSWAINERINPIDNPDSNKFRELSTHRNKEVERAGITSSRSHRKNNDLEINRMKKFPTSSRRRSRTISYNNHFFSRRWFELLSEIWSLRSRIISRFLTLFCSSIYGTIFNHSTTKRVCWIWREVETHCLSWQPFTVSHNTNPQDRTLEIWSQLFKGSFSWCCWKDFISHKLDELQVILRLR